MIDRAPESPACRHGPKHIDQRLAVVRLCASAANSGSMQTGPSFITPSMTALRRPMLSGSLIASTNFWAKSTVSVKLSARSHRFLADLPAVVTHHFNEQVEQRAALRLVFRLPVKLLDGGQASFFLSLTEDRCKLCQVISQELCRVMLITLPWRPG